MKDPSAFQIVTETGNRDIDATEIENRVLTRLKNEAQQQQLDTQRAMDKLSALQNEIYLKQKQSELTSAQFFNDMMGHSRLTMASNKYQPTYSMTKDTQKTSYTPHSPIKPPPYEKSPRIPEDADGLKKVDTKYLKLPVPSMA